MSDRKTTCIVAWCTAPHNDDGPHVTHHHASLAHNVAGGTLVSVLALWAETHDGRPGVGPHLAIVTGTSDPYRVDLMPREAESWAGLLAALGVPTWLTQALATGAQMLAPWDDRESDGLPHRVVDNPPIRTGRERFTLGLIIDIFDALENHGYRKANDAAGGRATTIIGDLIAAYEGEQQR